jgi:hypothetical protein
VLDEVLAVYIIERPVIERKRLFYVEEERILALAKVCIEPAVQDIASAAQL